MAGMIALNKIFTKNNILKAMNDDSKLKFYAKSLRYTHYDIFEYLYNELVKNYRSEYVYKNTLFNKLLLGKHNLNTTSALVELPVGKSIADFVLLNGTATVYEIKTELDSLDRLETQVNNYYKAFDLVYVVISENHLNSVMSILESTSVGIIVLTSRMTLSIKREAIRYTDRLDKNIWFSMLRKYEFEEILNAYYGFLPETNDFEYYNACRDLFLKIDYNLLYKKFLFCLKNRNFKKYSNEQIECLPKSLRSLIYFSKFSKSDYSKLISFLNN